MTTMVESEYGKTENSEKLLLTQRVIQVCRLKCPTGWSSTHTGMYWWTFGISIINPEGSSNSKKRAFRDTSDFSSARLQSGKELILVIAKLARLGETDDMYKHGKIELTHGLATQSSRFKK